MGLEAQCRVSFGGRSCEGKAHLETSELVFKGDIKLKIPLQDVRSVDARRGQLVVVFPLGTAILELGPAAEKWALKIRYPRGLLDKLGVKPGSRVAVIGIDDHDFREQLRSRTGDVTEGKPKQDSDLVFVQFMAKDELKRLAELRRTIKSNGAVWVVWPKGQRALTEDDVRAAGPGAGLVDVKVVSFSDTLSALKMMIPVKQR